MFFCCFRYILTITLRLNVIKMCVFSHISGIFGGMRAAMQLRSMLGEIGCNSVSNIFGIPKVHEAIKEDGSPIDSHMERYGCRPYSY